MSNPYLAMELAEEIHAEQHRDYSNAPYFVHLADVASTLMGHFRVIKRGYSVEEVDAMICAAWLHDSVEDQDYPLDLIEFEFGALVAGIVRDVTNIEGGPDKDERIIERLRNASNLAQNVKCADIISNCRDIAQVAPKRARSYLRKKMEQVLAMKKADLDLSAKAFDTVAAGIVYLDQQGL